MAQSLNAKLAHLIKKAEEKGKIYEKGDYP
jgi:hypothetical protein